MHSRAKAFIGSVATAVPPYTVTQEQADRFLTEHCADRLSPRNLALMHKLFGHPAINKRNFAFESPECLINEDPDGRIARFTRWSVELSAEAVLKALSQSDLSINDVAGLVVNTCTGYICPGVSTYLAERLKLPSRIRLYDLVGSGCGGAVPNLQTAGSQLNGGDGAVVSVSVEICSATFQMGDDLGLLVSNALFADGAGAAVIWDRPEGLEMAASSSRYVQEHRDAIRYVHKKGQLYNQLSTSLPHLLKKAVSDVVADVLGPRSLRVEDVKHWALHTGGEKIINTIKTELGLSEAQVRPTRDILLRHGNMSSPTVWFVLKEILDAGIEKGDWCMMLAFGAGLSTHAYLLRKV